MKFSIKSIAAFLLVLALCLSLAACGGKTDDNKDTGGKSTQGESTNPEPSGSEAADSTPSDSKPAGPDVTEPEPSSPEATEPEPTVPDATEPAGPEGGDRVDMSIPEGTTLGSRIKDFSFTTYDGKEYSLYETLKTKDMVLINIWATWCGPCQQEFPYMTEAYEEYKDNIEVFALSCESEDTNEVLADYVSAMGMTFPVGRDAADLASLFKVNAIPTSIVVDRFGVICFIEAGSQTSLGNFERLFDAFVGDGYTESKLLDGIPAPVCDVTPSSEADLAAALNAEGGSLSFFNPSDNSLWPFTVTTDGDRSCVVSTNTGLDSTASSIGFNVEAKKGDVLVLDYKVSTEAGCDLLAIYVDGAEAPVKVFGGVRGWTSYAVELEAGSHTVLLTYEKDMYTSSNDDVAYIDNVRVLSGGEAIAALADNPVYPVSDETAIVPANEGAREIVFSDVNKILANNFGDAKYYIIPGDEAVFNITLEEGIDPDSICFYSDFDGSTAGLTDLLKDGVYTVATGIDSAETTGYTYCDVYLAQGDSVMYVLYFASEENVNAFIAQNLPEGESWTYADGTAPGTDALPGESVDVPAGYSAYSLVFTDQNGDPVPGVIANICDDSACTPMTSDENGEISFTYPSFAYHIQVIKVPEGYTYDTSIESYLSEEGGVTEITVTKN